MGLEFIFSIPLDTPYTYFHQEEVLHYLKVYSSSSSSIKKKS